MEEEWRQVNGFGGRYWVSNLGRVRSTYKRTGFSGIVNQQKQRNGYIKVDLKINGASKTIGVHRLVAQAFIPNPDNKAEVNHINGVKTDNRAENLEWVTRTENVKHSLDVLGHGGRPKRAVKCVETGKVYESLHAASKATGACLGPLYSALNGKYQTAGGYHWEYMS